MDSDQQITGIDGLCIVERWRADNGEDSFVVPFATTRPVNIVFHGEKKFDYGHYGIHLGQEDRLVFLGNSQIKIEALFIDCRRGSRTYKQKCALTLSPSSKRMLCIPPGVAHTFYGLEGVFTLNEYKLFLPRPEDWLNDNTLWDPDSDIINVPVDVEPTAIPQLQPNTCPASDVFYQVMAAQQANALKEKKFMHAETEQVSLDDGSVVTLSIRQPLAQVKSDVSQEPESGISGLRWQQHYCLLTGSDSGIVPLLDPAPLYLVDHGENQYAHDAFGIHTCQEDRLTFLGAANEKITVHLVDCRQGSSTLHQEVHMEFAPSAEKYLVIPPGVAHRFEGLGSVYTVNRPAVFVDDWRSYDSSNDVIDWPIDNLDYPVLVVTDKQAPQEFYNMQARVQQRLISQPETATPIVLMATDENGKAVKLAIRKVSVMEQ